jgi:hypothetical protein
MKNRHTEYSSRNRYKVSNYREKSSDKGIEKSIPLKKFLCFFIFFLRNKKVFAILNNKWFPNIFSEYIICSSPYKRPKSSSKSGKKWIKSTIISNPACRNHNKF